MRILRNHSLTKKAKNRKESNFGRLLTFSFQIIYRTCKRQTFSPGCELSISKGNLEIER